MKLGYTPLGEEGFEQLARLKSLVTINLGSLRGRKDLSLLLKLHALPALRRLYLDEWQFSESDREKLKKLMPNCLLRID